MPRELAQKRNVRAHLADAARQSGAPLLVEGRSRGRLLRALVERRVVGVEPVEVILCKQAASLSPASM